MQPLNTKDVRHFLGYVAEKGINTETRTIRFVISSDKIDRDNERIEMPAIAAAIKDFAKNPICPACHKLKLENGMPPVVGSWDTDSFRATAHICEMDLIFATTELAEEYWILYRDKHMRAVSIGFIPLDGHEEQTEKNGHIFIITKLELVEISCVLIGANREALAKKGWILDDNAPLDVKAVADTVADAIKGQITIWLNENETIIQIHDDLEEIKSLLCHDHGELAKEFMLDGSCDRPVPAGKENITEQKIKEMLMKAITNL